MLRAGLPQRKSWLSRSSLCRLAAETHSSSGVEVLAVGRVVLRKFRGDVVEKLAAEALSQGDAALFEPLLGP